MIKLFYVIILCAGIADACAQTLNVTYKSFSKTNSDPDYSITATYPQADFGPDALMGVRGIAADINNSLDTIVNAVISDFEKQVSEMPSDAVHGTSSLEITGEGWVSNQKILSAEIATFSNVSGMAHPLTTVNGYNYDISGMGPLSLSDLFLGDEYLYFVSAACIKKLMDHSKKEGYLNTGDMILSGAAADTSNYTDWVIKNDSLKIIFKPYQVGPYVMGIQTVSIPLSDMTEMIDPKGPLEFMIR